MSGIRLHVKGVVLGYQRSREVQRPNHVLLRLPQVATRKDAEWYAGKKVAYYYKAKTMKNGSKLRVIWGKVTAPHGNSGVVKAKFDKNLPSNAFAHTCRIFMYPSSCQ